jgi:hypothetical protein
VIQLCGALAAAICSRGVRGPSGAKSGNVSTVASIPDRSLESWVVAWVIASVTIVLAVSADAPADWYAELPKIFTP